MGPLSPVQESPEYRSVSSESVFQLEHDLDTALSRLDTETSDIKVDQKAVEQMEAGMQAGMRDVHQERVEPVPLGPPAAASPVVGGSGQSDSVFTPTEAASTVWKSGHRPRSGDSGMFSSASAEGEFTTL